MISKLLHFTFCGFIFCGLFSLNLSAQISRPALRNYNTDQGLPSSEVYITYQDKMGYMWFGTDNGVSRFNGYRFVNFGPLQGLSDPVAFYIQEDSKGVLWVLTMSGKLFFLENEKFVPFAYNNAFLKQTHGNFPSSFYIDSQNIFHIGINKGGVFDVAQNGEIKQKTSSNEELIIEIVENRVIFAATSSLAQHDFLAIRLLKNGQTNFFSFKNNNKISSATRIGVVHQDTILLHFQGELYCFTAKNLLWQKKYEDGLNHIFTDESGIYFSFNNQKGLQHFDNLKAVFENKGKTLLDKQRGGGVFRDKNNAFWFTTIDNGVYYASNQNISIFNLNSGLSSDYISSIAPFSFEKSYVLLRNSELYELNYKQQSLQKINTAPSVLAFNTLIWDERKQSLWQSSNTSIINRYHNGKRESITTVKPLIFGGYSMYQKKGSRYLWAINHNGFSQFDTENQRVIYATEEDTTVLHARTLTLLEHSDGRILVGNVKGLFEFREGKLLKSTMPHDAVEKRIEAVVELLDGTVAVGTKGSGVILWKNNKIEAQFTSETEQHLTSDMIENLHVADDGTLWIGTLNGVNTLRKNEKQKWEIGTLTTAQGLPSNEINSIKSYQSTIYIATPKGLAVFEDEKKETILNEKPIIEQVFSNNTKIDFLQTNEFNHDQNSFTIAFITLAYQSNGNIEYRYRLHSYDDWNSTFDKKITFAALPYGNYNFEIQSKNDDGSFTQSTFWNFSIATPWWKTVWFFLAISVLGIGIFYAWSRWRFNKIQSEANAQTELIQLQNKALQAQMNPHFLFNCLNSIQSMIATGENEAATQYLSLFAKLVRNVLNASSNNKITLEDDINLLQNYLILEKLRFKERVNYQINVSPDIDQYDIMLPPLLVQPYVENAIIHGISDPSIERGNIIIDYKQKGELLIITISDNGIGMTKSQERKNADTTHKSVGMKITQERLRIAQLRKTKHEFSMEEITDEQGNVKGTKVVLSVPV